MLFSDDGPAEWITLFRGAKPVFDVHSSSIATGILAPMIQPGRVAALQSSVGLPSVETEKLDRLRVLIQTTSPEEAEILNTAVDNLSTLFSSRYGVDGRKSQTTFQSIGIWLWRCSIEYTTLLQQRNPAALAIFAHAFVAFNDLSSNWMIKGWIPHLLSGIHQRLPLEYHPWIQWPIQQIGWIPPSKSTP